MNSNLKVLAGLALCALLAPASPLADAPRAAAPNVIQGIGVSDAAGGVELEIRGTRAPTYTVFKLQDPPRLVVDLAGADVSAVAARVAGKGAVREITTAQYKDEKSAVGRVVLVLDGQPRYEVAARGEALLVTLHASSEESPRVAPAPPSSTPDVVSR